MEQPGSSNRLWRSSLLLCFVVLVGLARPARAESYSFAVVPHRSVLLTARYWNPILEYLQKKTGIVLQLEVSKSVAANAAAIENGDYDLTQSMLIFRPKALKQNYRVLLRPRGALIRSQLIVLASSPIKSLGELRGRNVAFPAKSGFIAYALPMDFLLRHGIPVSPLFAGNQEGALGQLRVGEADAAAVSSQVTEAYSAREGIKFRSLWESPPYLDLPIAAHPRLPEAVTSQIQQALATMADNPEGLKILEAAANVVGQKPPYGFSKASAADYAGHSDFYRRTLVKDLE